MLNNVKIRPKLLGGFGIVIALTVVIGMLGMSNLNKMNEMLGSLYENHLIGINAVQEANINLICIDRALRQTLLAKNEEERTAQLAEMEKYSDALRNNMKVTESTIVSAEGRKLFGTILQEFETYKKQIDKLTGDVEKSEYIKLTTVIDNELASTYKQAEITNKRFADGAVMKVNLGKKTYEESKAIYSSIRTMLVLFIVIAAIAGILIGLILSKSICDPLNKMVEMVKELSQGHLKMRLQLNRKDEVGDIADTLDQFANDLQCLLVVAMRKVSDGDVSLDVAGKDSQDELIPALKGIIDSLRGLIAEINMLTQEAIKGNLSVRGRQELFKGAYREIIEGINSTINQICIPVNEAAEVLQKVAERDMTVRVTGDYKGDHEKIKNAVNSTVDNLNSALLQVTQATEQVSSASQQISSGSQSLAQGANEQASSLEEVSSSLEEMASMTKQNADNALQAKQLATEANDNAQQGKDAVSRMTGAINKIKESSDQTAKIVKTIDEIAMQTNLLALNAAVEAARAGDAGRGFAVVAEEVRNLAQRSAQAAKNTADMIAESVKNSEEGVVIAGDVSKTFMSIAESNGKVDTLISEIASASQEQSQGIDQVNVAVAQLDRIIQQNAANSEESASAAEELNSQAEELQNMAGQFKLTYSDMTESRINGRPASGMKQNDTYSLCDNMAPERKKTTDKKQKSTACNSRKEQNQAKIVSSGNFGTALEDNAKLKDF